VADAKRYLLPSERRVIEVRRHWAVLAVDTIQSLGLLVIGIVLLRLAPHSGFLRTLAVYFIVFVVARWGWIMADWYVEKFIVTDKRVLLLTGIVTRKVAIMPLIKVTDLTYNRSSTGLMLGYGEFVVESAGQDQALSRINFIPQPEKLYMQVSELLFGGEKGMPALPSPGEREAELAAGARVLRRWRPPWSGWRRRRDDTSPAYREEPLSGLDDLPTRRDTPLAEPEGRRRQEPGRGFSDDAPTAQMPRVHDPRRNAGRGDVTWQEPPPRRGLPPRSTEEPPHAPPIDPADD